MSKELDELIETSGEETVLAIMEEYHEEIDRLMSSNTDKDLREMMMDPEHKNKCEGLRIEEVAGYVTTIRMRRYGNAFFDVELHRLMDKYNDEEISTDEYLLRCHIVSELKSSLENIKF